MCGAHATVRGFLGEVVARAESDRHVVVDTRMRTSVEGVYAAGDITDYDGKVRLISVGFGEVATAVNNAAVDPATKSPILGPPATTTNA